MINSVVIKIGGSIFYEDDLKINLVFLKKVVDWYKKQKVYENVIFVVGGGRIGRFLLNQVKEEIHLENLKHKIGIKATHTNAVIFLSLFDSENIKYFESITELCSKIKQEGIKGAIIGGVMEGWSTDMVAANVANNLGIRDIHKISDVDYIYSADPNQQKNAEPFDSLTWEEYIKIFNSQIGYKHKPGMSAPIDIECSLFCRENGLNFRISGGNLNLEIIELLNSGTLVSN